MGVLNDDDNKIQINVIEKTLNKCIQFGIEAVVNTIRKWMSSMNTTRFIKR
jgi:hypothetical protein